MHEIFPMALFVQILEHAVPGTQFCTGASGPAPPPGRPSNRKDPCMRRWIFEPKRQIARRVRPVVTQALARPWRFEVVLGPADALLQGRLPMVPEACGHAAVLA